MTGARAIRAAREGVYSRSLVEPSRGRMAVDDVGGLRRRADAVRPAAGARDHQVLAQRAEAAKRRRIQRQEGAKGSVNGNPVHRGAPDVSLPELRERRVGPVDRGVDRRLRPDPRRARGRRARRLRAGSGSRARSRRSRPPRGSKPEPARPRRHAIRACGRSSHASRWGRFRSRGPIRRTGTRRGRRRNLAGRRDHQARLDPRARDRRDPRGGQGACSRHRTGRDAASAGERARRRAPRQGEPRPRVPAARTAARAAEQRRGVHLRCVGPAARRDPGGASRPGGGPSARASRGTCSRARARAGRGDDPEPAPEPVAAVAASRSPPPSLHPRRSQSQSPSRPRRSPRQSLLRLPPSRPPRSRTSSPS